MIRSPVRCIWVGGLLTGVFLLACPLFSAASEATATVESRLLQREYRFFAFVDYRSRYKLYAQETGTLESHALRENAVCQAGDIVVTLKNDTLRLNLLQRRAQWIEARNALQQAELSLRHGQVAREEAERAKAQLALAEASHIMAQEAVASLTLHAPFQGRILRVAPKLSTAHNQNVTSIERGELLAEFIRELPPVLRGAVALPYESPNMESCKLVVEENGRMVEAVLLGWQQANGAQNGNVREVMLEPPHDLRQAEPGTPVAAALILPARLAVRTVPRSFVLNKGDMRYCLVARPEGTTEIGVMTGEYDTTHVEVFGNLDPGETVVRPGEH